MPWASSKESQGDRILTFLGRTQEGIHTAAVSGIQNYCLKTEESCNFDF